MFKIKNWLDLNHLKASLFSKLFRSIAKCIMFFLPLLHIDHNQYID